VTGPTRRLEACYFAPLTPDAQADWPRLAAVLDRSARHWCPGWAIRVQELPSPTPRPGARAESYLANTWKLEAWQAAIDEAADGDEVVLLDADTMITGPLDPIWDQPFELAYTRREASSRVPLNAGVIFVRVSPEVRDFFDLWVAENALMLGSAEAHAVWRHRYMGVNQSALGKLLETGVAARTVDLLAVPCAEWNCENDAWASFDPDGTRIVHIKDNLRQAVFRQGPTPPGCEAIVARWRALDDRPV
jgi:hypothetical protein